MQKIRIGINGYGNLGRSAEIGIRQFPDLEAAGIFTRRDPDSIHPVISGLPVYSLDQAAGLADRIDVMLLCSGSMQDLPEQGPAMACLFNTVDGFDTHARIPEYCAAMDRASRGARKTSIVSVGWDPGLLSLQRLLARTFLPQGKDETFWGKGVSQGHSEAIRQIRGVKDARQYTVPKEAAIEAVRGGLQPDLTTADKHSRECYVVVEPDADLSAIEAEIKSMPHYFADYETAVHFISQDELERDHQGLPHSGLMIRSGSTGQNREHGHTMSFDIQLDSNPDFTAHVLLACARAAWKMAQSGQYGAKTIFDIPPIYLSDRSAEELIRMLL
jgi:diaminopimelate dehydrogenase